MNLKDILINTAKLTPDAVAVQVVGEHMTYGALDSLSNHLAQTLSLMGVVPGNRVGIWLEKSALTIAAMQGALRLNAVYVPLDPLSPTMRIVTILCDCTVQIVVTTKKRAALIAAAQYEHHHVVCLCIDALEMDTNRVNTIKDAEIQVINDVAPIYDMAYILYTSGSTGKPKGVCISNRNALAFIEWAYEELQATPDDHLANHAPFHFDLSVLDLYVAFKAGATVCLIPDGTSYIPTQLTTFLLQEKPTIWYSVPSVLILMIEQGGMLDIEHLPLRVLLYAGEAFPVKYVRNISDQWPTMRILNLYGPTETNVCTFYEVQNSLLEQMKQIPIGKACSGNQIWAQKEDGSVARSGEQGELLVNGPTVMLGYWGQPNHEKKPYATGDIVRMLDDGNYVCVGRKDHMVKVRGYRIEPGDIEATLEEHAAISEAAVLIMGIEMEARLVAFVTVANTKEVPTLLEIKRHCAERLPRYMIVDALHILAALPRTRNGKVDRLALSTE